MQTQLDCLLSDSHVNCLAHPQVFSVLQPDYTSAQVEPNWSYAGSFKLFAFLLFLYPIWTNSNYKSGLTPTLPKKVNIQKCIKLWTRIKSFFHAQHQPGYTLEDFNHTNKNISDQLLTWQTLDLINYRIPYDHQTTSLLINPTSDLLWFCTVKHGLRSNPVKRQIININGLEKQLRKTQTF